jgi:hypothetical protein
MYQRHSEPDVYSGDHSSWRGVLKLEACVDVREGENVNLQELVELEVVWGLFGVDEANCDRC